jgi:phospholipid transport system transporter-binding protein
MADPVTLQVRGEGRCAVAGALTFETVPALWQQLKANGLLDAGCEADLTGVTDADSAGLALLVAWRGNCAVAGGNLALQAVPPRIVALARITDGEAALGPVSGGA